MTKKQLRLQRHVLKLMGEGWRLLSPNRSGQNARLASKFHAVEEEVDTPILLRLVASGLIKAGDIDPSSRRLQWKLTEAGKKAIADASAPAQSPQEPAG